MPALYADVAMDADKSTELKCMKKHCNQQRGTRYSGLHNSQRLGVKLAEAALRAKLNGEAAVYRLTD
jgi:hypothetical protein